MYILQFATPYVCYLYEVQDDGSNSIAYMLIYSFEYGQFISSISKKLPQINNENDHQAVKRLYLIGDSIEKLHFESVEQALTHLNNLLVLV